MAAALDDLTGKPHGHKIFRVHRDVRFSKDKTPYNAYLRIAFIPKTGVPSWFFGFDPDKLGLGTGVFAFDKADLHRFRERILGSEGAELVRVMDELEGCGIRFGEPDLKRVPAGLPKDHPREKLLRYKGLSAWVDHPDPTWIAKRDVVDACMADFARLKPVFDWLDA
jgi:uncharacterized protein (TIGR02453 family)